MCYTCDVKPENLMVREGTRQVVVVDFGVGSLEGYTPLEGYGALVGTPEYLSPEALCFQRDNLGERVHYPHGPADEVWALGCTLYWLLTNRLPFGHRGSPHLAAAILHEAPKAPHEYNPRVPQALSEVCLRMLEKERSRRYMDMAEVCAALEAVLARAEGEGTWEVPLFDVRAVEVQPTEEVDGMVEPDAGLREWQRLAKQARYRQQMPRGRHHAPAPVEEPPMDTEEMDTEDEELSALEAEDEEVLGVEAAVPPVLAQLEEERHVEARAQQEAPPAEPPPEPTVEQEDEGGLAEPPRREEAHRKNVTPSRWWATGAVLALVGMVATGVWGWTLTRTPAATPAVAPVARTSPTLHAWGSHEVAQPSRMSEAPPGTSPFAAALLASPAAMAHNAPSPVPPTPLTPAPAAPAAPRAAGTLVNLKRAGALGLLAASACATQAAPFTQVSWTVDLPQPTLEKCPPGSVSLHPYIPGWDSVDALAGHFQPGSGEYKDASWVEMGPGEVSTRRYPNGSWLKGRVWLGRCRADIRFTELHLPDHSVVPICVQHLAGLRIEGPGKVPGTASMWNNLNLEDMVRGRRGVDDEHPQGYWRPVRDTKNGWPP